MKLINCYIENFGLLHAANFNFSKSLNCCISENGTGKTTLTAFIEAMLYGIGDTRRQALDENPRKKYMPWQGGKFGGSLTIEVGKKKYIIERSFGQRPADDTFRLIDADSGRVSNDYGDDIGEKLFGIDRDGFLRTAFLSEKNLQGKNDNKSISAKLSDLVGVDGDVGGFDDALKLLEDRRKFYFKKGNTGEIANVKERILECQRKMDALLVLEQEVSQKEANLIELNKEKQRLKLYEQEQKNKLDSINRQRERQAHEDRYRAMLEATSKENDRLESAKVFFANGVPSTEAIDAARDAYYEADRLKREALSEKGNEEYVELADFFKNSTGFAEISDAERYAELAEERSREITSIENGTDDISYKMSRIFNGAPPKKSDIDSAEKSSKPNMLKFLAIALGVAVAIGGLVIGNIPGYVLLITGAIIAICSLFLLKNTTKSKELAVLIEKYGDGNRDDKLALEKIKSKLANYDDLADDRRKRADQLKDEYERYTLKVYAFLEKFPHVDETTPLNAVKYIKRKYNQYYALGQAGEVAASGKLEKLKRSEELARSAQSFIQRFPITTASPFTEIRDNLNQYNYLKASVQRMVNDCEMYAVQYNVTGKSLANAAEDEAAIHASLTEIAEKSRALTASSALLEREVNIARSEIDKKDEYEMAKAELEELYNKHTDSLDIIKKTSLYLKEACDNITSKYLGKTKEKFEEYSKLIAGIDGDYTLNTSFELTKNERGESHGIESYSRGTRDLYALGLRFALVDALYENESPFIILDDPFIALDDAKLERAKSTLKSIAKNKQILYFTCAQSRVIE